ncbi:MAG: NUDIX domain-containing protein [Chloroflexota bacterium]
MQKDLSDFLAGGTRLCEETVVWGNGTLPLQITYYLGNKLPPVKYVSSVRAIVFRERSVLVITQENGQMYILPGGRVEKGELPLETLKREILEETGWTLLKTDLLGFMHFYHLGAKPEHYAYPYPDFLWLTYLAEAKNFNARAIIPDDYGFKSSFQPIEEVTKLPLREGELLLLDAALKLR